MLGDISGLEKIYIVCGYTDMRKSIDGLCAIIDDQLKIDPTSSGKPVFFSPAMICWICYVEMGRDSSQ